MRDHNAPVSLEAVQRRLYGLGYGANLIDFKQQAVARFGLNGPLDVFGICHSQVVANNLDLSRLEEEAPCLPVILCYSQRTVSPEDVFFLLTSANGSSIDTMG